MKKSTLFLIALVVIGVALQLWNTNRPPQVVVRTQTQNEAFDYVMELIKSSWYYEQHGYSVVLPTDKTFQKLYENPELVSQIDKDSLKNIFATKIYDQSVFAKPIKAAHAAINTVKKGLRKLAQLKTNWGFALKPKYEIVISPYGAHATHQLLPNVGKITLLADKQNAFSPEEYSVMILKKIVNIGIEEKIIEKYNLSKWQKEQLISLICKRFLNDVIPYYRTDDITKRFGDKSIGAFVTRQAIIQDLPAAIEKFKASFKSF